MGTSRLGQMLVEEGLLTERDRRTIKRNCGYGSAAFAKSIVACGIMDETELASFLAEKTRNELASKDLQRDASPEAMGAIDHPLLERLEVIPIEVRGKTLKVAMADPLDLDTISQLEFFTGYKVKPVIATFSQIFGTLKGLITEFEPQLTSLEKFLHNYATPASKRLKIVQGATIADEPRINDHLQSGGFAEPEVDVDDEEDVEEIEEYVEDDSEDEYDEFDEEVEELEADEAEAAEEPVRSAGPKDRYGDLADAEEDEDVVFEDEIDDEAMEAEGSADDFAAFDAVESLEGEGDDSIETAGLELNAGGSLDEGALEEQEIATASEGDDEMAALASETFDGSSDETDTSATQKVGKADEDDAIGGDTLDDLEAVVDDDLNVAMSDDDIAADLSALGGFDEGSMDLDLGDDPLLAKESAEGHATSGEDPMPQVTAKDQLAGESGSDDLDLGDLDMLADLSPTEEATAAAAAEAFDDLDADDPAELDAQSDMDDLPEETSAELSGPSDSADSDDLNLDDLDTGLGNDTSELDDAFGQHEAMLEDTVKPKPSPEDLKHLTMHAIGSLNKVLLKLSLKTDPVDIVELVGDAFSCAGIHRGIVMSLEEGSAIHTKIAWHFEDGNVEVEQEGLDRFVTDGLPKALERLFPGWTTFDDSTRASNMLPFNEWLGEDTQLAAAMLPAGSRQAAIIVAWEPPYCDSEGIRGAALELSRRFVKKILN